MCRKSFFVCRNTLLGGQCAIQCCGYEMFIPESEFFHCGSRIQGQKDSRSQIRIKELSIFNMPVNESSINVLKFNPGKKQHCINSQTLQLIR